MTAKTPSSTGQEMGRRATLPSYRRAIPFAIVAATLVLCLLAYVIYQDGDYLRNAERHWIQARDDGLKFYLEHVPGTERQQRRLQFLGDATAKRIFDLTPPDSDD